MAVVFDAQGTAVGIDGSTTFIDFTNLTIGSSANRALIVVMAFSVKTISALTLTWDNGGTNQLMTLIGAVNSPGIGRSVMYGLVAPTSGNKTLHAAWTTSSAIKIDAVSYSGVDQTGGVTSFPHFTSATGTSTSTPTVTVTSAIGNAVVACGNTDATSFGPNETLVYSDNSQTPVSWANRAAGAATVTMSADISTGDNWVEIGVDIVAAPPGSTNRARTLLGVGTFLVHHRDSVMTRRGLIKPWGWRKE